MINECGVELSTMQPTKSGRSKINPTLTSLQDRLELVTIQTHPAMVTRPQTVAICRRRYLELVMVLT